MKWLVIALAALLSACAHAPLPDLGQAPAARMPALPEALRTPAKRLPAITDPTLGGINQSGAQTDADYNALAWRYNALLGTYECVRQALDAKDAKKAQECLSAQ